MPHKTPDFKENPPVDEVYITWLGHSAIFIQMHGMNILIDPVFTDRASPVSFVGPERFSEPFIKAETADLAVTLRIFTIDTVILTL